MGRSSSWRGDAPATPGIAWRSAAASAALLAAATAQIGLGLLVFVGLVPLLLAIDRDPHPGRAAAAGWFCGILFFSAALAWVPLAGFRGLLLAVPAAYVLVLAASLAIYAGSLAWLRRHDRALCFAIAPLLWVAIEYARSSGTLGYPWHHIGYALAGHPQLIQLASIGGVPALSLWIAAVSSALVAFRHTPLPALALGFALIAAPLPLALRGSTPAGSISIAAVQPHIQAQGRAETARFRANLGTLIELTDGLTRARPDLIVWPESAYERAIGNGPDLLLGAIAHHYGTPLLTGAWRVANGAHPDLYNSAVLVGRSGDIEVAGDKVHPVPFYEGTPATPVERLAAKFVAWPGHFRAGERPGLAWVERRGAPPLGVGVLICLDSSYPGLARELRRRGADLLVEISNESLTGDWSAEQHALVSRLRAVESGLPLVRVANVGPTEWIDAHGRVVARLGTGDAAAATRELPAAGAAPPYVRLGDAPAFTAGLLPPLLLLARRSRSNARRSADTHHEEIRS